MYFIFSKGVSLLSAPVNDDDSFVVTHSTLQSQKIRQCSEIHC
jgi:hypothetical protein